MAQLTALGIPRNHLLSSLSVADFGLLKPSLETIALGLRKVLEAPNKPITHVYFPLSGIVSVVTASTRKRQIEVGIIGREGMTGINTVLGNNRSLHSTYVQSAGRSQCIKAADLRQAMQKSASLRDGLLRFVQAFMTQTAYTALANGQAKITERLARWLLMAQDRLDGNELALTHEFLALMLCVQRPGVTMAMNLLESRGFVRAKRGIVIVIDRAGLKALADGLYGIPEAEYRRLIGGRAKDQR
jgi:CRP-like cAMP-binding protein